MIYEIFGLLCLLIATIGFGFINWGQNKKISGLEDDIEGLNTERNHYARAYERFTSMEFKPLMHELLFNVALLFGKIDCKFSGKINPKTEEGIKTANENMLKEDRKRLLVYLSLSFLLFLLLILLLFILYTRVILFIFLFNFFIPPLYIHIPGT